MEQELKEEWKELTYKFFAKHNLKTFDILGLLGLSKFWTYHKVKDRLVGY